MKRMAAYCRVSTDQQVREGESIASQVVALEEYAKKHNYALVGTYIDDGVSGTLVERDELQRMLEDVRKGKIDVIAFTRLDRWFRSVRHYLNTQAVLDEHNVGWIAIWENYETESPAGRLMVNQMLSFAQFEAENAAVRINRVFDYKKSKREVLSGKIPYGFKIQDKHLVIDEPKAEIVRRAFDLYIQNGSLGEVMRLTEGQGLPKSQRAFKWMLQNEKYVGKSYGYDDFCPAIIDQKTFDVVQDMLKGNIKRGRTHEYIFTGLVCCKDCGCKMTGSTDRYKKKETRYKLYRCMHHYRPLPTCDNGKQLNELKLEKYLIKNLENLYFEKVEASKSKETIDYGKLIVNTEKKMARLKDLYINELITLDEYKKDAADYQAQIADYTAKMSQSENTSLDELQRLVGTNLADWYWTLTCAEKRTLWRSVIQKIIFGSDKTIEVIFR